MYKKNYEDYLKVLRTRPVHPPMEQIARLIARAPVRGGNAIPLFAKLVGALALGGMIAAGSWILFARFHAANAPQKITLLKNASSHSPLLINAPHLSYVSLAPHGSQLSKNAGSIFSSPDSLVLYSEDADNTNAPIIPCSVQEQPIALHPIAADTHSFLPISIPNSEMESNFFATLSESITQQINSNAAYRQTSFSDAFFGVGYSLSEYSSVRMLVGEENFVVTSSTTTNSISFHDTTFVHGGQTYQNVIGEIQSVNLPTTIRTYWLGASYRYTFGDAATAIRPFAEAMAGGSTNGFLTHQSLGAEFLVTGRTDLDLLFETSELLPPNSSWLTKAGFAATLSYRW